MQHELFNIGITLYILYSNSLPFYKEKDFILYKKYVLEENPIKADDFDHSEYPSFIKLYNDIKEHRRYNTKENKKEAILLSISERRDKWIDNLTKDNIVKKDDFYNDKSFYDLLYRLIKYNTKESITNYNDFYNHPFFSQYQY